MNGVYLKIVVGVVLVLAAFGVVLNATNGSQQGAAILLAVIAGVSLSSGITAYRKSAPSV
jgi:hypothetical protein